MKSNLFLEEYEKIKEDLADNWKLFKNKSILITGATGLVGSYLTNFLIYLNNKLSLNIKLYCMSRNIEKLKSLFNDNVIYIVKDLNNTIFTLDFEPDYIIHCASNTHPLAYSKFPVETLKTNLLGTISLLESIKEKKCKFIFLSTCQIYGNNTSSDAFSEDDYGICNSKDVRSCYNESKRAAETTCVCYGEEYNVNFNVLRLPSIYGANFSSESSKFDVQFFKNAINSENIIMKSDGLRKRSFLYVGDVVESIFFIIFNGKNREFYNVANDEVKTIKDFANILAKTAGVDIIFQIPDSIESKGYSKNGNEIISGEKLMSLGWKSNYNLESGIKRTYYLLKNIHNE